MRRAAPARRLAPIAALAVALSGSGIAYANTQPGKTTTPTPASSAGAHGSELYASASYSQIKVRQVSGPTGDKRGNLATSDLNWKPPACWYEPVFTGEALKAFVDKTDGQGDVGIHESWYGKQLWTDHYQDGKSSTNFDDTNTTAEGYKDYNIGKHGYFWRSVAPDPSDPDSWTCGKIMFWQNAGQIPKIPHAPTPEMLAEYAYNKIKVPKTEIQVDPTAKSTVNLPTWVWLDKGTFQEIKVRAELPHTSLWAETTAKPIALHLDPGTTDAATTPSSGDCTINADGSIGTPYENGDADKTPPCAITYLHATDGRPYQLKASLTWQITWTGSDGTGGNLPNGTFDATQDMNVQEIQAVNR